MIHHSYRCIQVHIPKTGGLTIRRNLLGESDTDKFMHRTPSFGPYQKFWNDYTTFTFVRNPFDRLLSAFSFTKDFKNPLSPNNKIFIQEFRNLDVSFEDFVLSLETRQLKNNERRSYTAYIHQRFKSMKDWFVDKTTGKEFSYDFIGRCENFVDDYNTICERLGVVDKSFKIINKSTNRDCDYRKYYTSKMIEVVERMYEWDLQRFKYTFEGVEL